MKSCVVRAHHAGLGSILNNLIMWCCEYDEVYPDWSTCLYGPDTWNALFHPVHLPDGEHDIVGIHPSQFLTYRNAGKLYLGQVPEHRDWRATCHAHWRKLHVRSEITEFVDAFVRDRFNVGKVVAALVRSHGLAGEQISGRSQTLEEYARAIERENPGVLYVASSDWESLAWLKARFPRTVQHPLSARAPHRGIERHLSTPQTPLDAINCLQEVLIMSHADALVHPVSNLATVALYANPQLKSVYLP